MGTTEERRGKGRIMGLGLGALLLVALAAADPAAHGWFPKCMIHTHTGLHCAGCGMTRAAHLLLRGEVLAALRMNALLTLCIPVIGVLWAARHLGPASALERVSDRVGLRATLAMLGVLILYAVLRNLPFAPFNWLAPT